MAEIMLDGVRVNSDLWHLDKGGQKIVFGFGHLGELPLPNMTVGQLLELSRMGLENNIGHLDWVDLVRYGLTPTGITPASLEVTLPQAGTMAVVTGLTAAALDLAGRGFEPKAIRDKLRMNFREAKVLELIAQELSLATCLGIVDYK